MIFATKRPVADAERDHFDRVWVFYCARLPGLLGRRVHLRIVEGALSAQSDAKYLAHPGL